MDMINEIYNVEKKAFTEAAEKLLNKIHRTE